MDKWQWTWAGDWGKAELIDDALASQASYFGSCTSRLSNQLSTLSKDVSQRIDVLTKAFIAYVQLDGVRQELTGFADHARARRQARAAVAALVEEGRSTVVEDVSGYWLAPAVNAVRPDGSLDAALFAEAISRDEQSATRFALALRAALGVGTQCIDELVTVLSQHDDSLGWDAVQMMLWAAVLRGAFGPAGLQALAPIAEQAFAAMDAAGWGQWLAAAATDHPAMKGRRLRGISDGQMAQWVGDRLSEVVEPVDGTVAEDHWQGTWIAPPSLGNGIGGPERGHEAMTGGEAAASGAESEALAPEEPLLENVSPGAAEEQMSAEESTRAMLLRVVDHLVTRGAQGEQELLRHAERLHADVVGPLGLGDQVSLVDELPLSPASVMDAIGSAGFDSNAALVDRRVILEWMGPHLREWSHSISEAPATAASQIRVAGHPELVATATGVGDRAALARAMGELGSTTGGGARNVGPIILGTGTGILVVMGLLLMIIAHHPGIGVLCIAMALGCGFGFATIASKIRAHEEFRRRRQESLERAVESATRRARELDAKNAAKHQALQAMIQRLQSLIPEPGGC